MKKIQTKLGIDRTQLLIATIGLATTTSILVLFVINAISNGIKAF